MLFMMNGRPKAGVTRDELILHLTRVQTQLSQYATRAAR